MTLDDIEKLASDHIAGHPVGNECYACDLARAVLPMLPVVRAAMESTDYISRECRVHRYGDAHRHKIADAIDSFRSSMARLAGDV